MKRSYSYAASLISTVFVCVCISGAQVQVATGTPPFSSLGGGPFDVVNLGNLNVHFAVPVIHKAGRGMSFDYDLSYDGSIWTPVTSSGTTSWQPDSNWGWKGQSEASLGYVVQSSKLTSCRWFDGRLWHTTYYTIWTTSGYSDPFGVFHAMRVITDNGSDATCGGNTDGTASANDGSGYSIAVSGSIPTVTSRSGAVINASTLRNGSGTRTDANGNQISVSSGTFTDTLGKAVLTATGLGTPSSPLQFGYIPPANEISGTRVYVKVNYLSYTVKTNFGATTSGSSPIGEYGPTSIPLVDNITLPDGTHYNFTYETTPGSCTPNSGDHLPSCVTGRIASVTLPTGGTINYTYSGGSQGIFNDGSTAALIRVISPNTSCSSSGCWQYSRTLVSGNPGPGSTWTMLVTDPNSNQTSINFSEDGGANYNFYETQRRAYQGSVSASACSSTVTNNCLLLTTTTCYNGNASACATATVSSPISNRTGILQYPNSGLQSKTVTNYNGLGLVTETDQYAYGSGAPGGVVRKTAVTYASLGNNILDRPSTVTIKDSGNVVKASTIYTYDEGTPTAPPGTTPQHTSITGSRGNLTTVASQVSDLVTLYHHLTYYDTGAVHTATDTGTTASGGPNLTTYNYPDATSTCGNAFPTSVSEPLSLSRSFVWDCTGGVQTSVTDENTKTTTVSYAGTGADPNFWRPYQAQDQLTNTTTFSYPSWTVSESTLAFNSNHSVVDHRTTLDAFGRPIIGQTEQGYNSTSYDSVETYYDVMGRPWKGTMPYVGAAGSLCTGTCLGASTTYDAVSRPLSVSDAGTGTINYTYTQNDVLQVLGPAPNGEHTKQKQLEYDALGRLTSVCEITSASGSGSGPCSQTSGQTGLWTQYTYDLLGNMIGVNQNSQTSTYGPQTRTFTFDMMGRRLSETNPETGTVSYTYDSADATCGSYSSPGDLVEKKDAMNNVSCFTYDGLHRVSSITYGGTGSYSANTDKKNFVYDAASASGFTLTNTKGRLAEAYTCPPSGSCTTKKTDLVFSYSARGETQDVWESTPNSGGYYHVNATYWAHGALNVLNGGSNPLPGLPAITYGAADGSGIDGEGRITKVNAASGQNPVTGVAYTASGTTQPIGSLTQITFGSQDSDAYSYDTNTGRMTQYKFNMGTGPQSQTGALTWNANGTLQQLQITDQINTANSQTCKFGDPSASVPGYDDLGRLISANCASAWSQTFAFDPFGNLSKSGSAQFLPTYTSSPPTNRYASIPGGSVSYDGNGNLTNDVTHSYTWDADGNNTGVDSSITMIYDASDRMVEQTRGSAHQQIVYGPGGMKLALMNGQTFSLAFVKLPGGVRAVYNSSGLAYYRHSDHLGSSRLSTTTSRTKYYDVAYAPYGEDYNGSGTTPDLAFTDQNQDTAGNGWSSNLYDFLMREYRTAHGRWTSPDPAGAGAVNPASPQSWNRYAYVINNPLSFTDPLGLQHGSGSSGQCEQCDPMFQAIWIDQGLTSIGGVCFMCGGPGGSLDYGAGQGAGMWQVTTPSVFVEAETAYDRMVAGILSVPGAIWVNCSGTLSGDSITSLDCGAPSGAVPGSQSYIWNAPVEWSQALRDPILGTAARSMNKVTAAYALAFGTVAGGAVFSELALASDSTAIADPLIANSDKVLAQTDLYHNFGELVGREAMQNGELAIQNGSYLQWNIPGFMNGASGVFQYGGLLSPTGGVLYVTHTFFQGQ